MPIVEILKRVAQGKQAGNFQQRVVGTINNVTGIRHDEMTYVGCSKMVTGARDVHWHCRKRISPEDRRPNEVLNHDHKHEGPCSPPENGILCYSMQVSVYDATGTLTAEVWAPAYYLLGMGPAMWLGASRALHAQKIDVATKKSFIMDILSVYDGQRHSHYKIQFVKEDTPEPYDWQKTNPSACGLPAVLSCLTLGGLDSEEAENQITNHLLSFNEETPGFAGLQAALRQLIKSQDSTGQAIKLLQEVVYVLATRGQNM